MNIQEMSGYVTKALIAVALCIPTFLVIATYLQYQRLNEKIMLLEDKSQQIVCITPEICVVEIMGNWYQVRAIDAGKPTSPRYDFLNLDKITIK